MAAQAERDATEKMVGGGVGAKRRYCDARVCDPAGRIRGRLGPQTFPAHDIVALDHGSDSYGLVVVVRVLVDADDSPVRSNEYLGAAGDFGRKSEREIQLGAWGEIVGHGEVDAARGNVASLSAVRPRLAIDRHPDIDRQR
jgi:hypothetical protein